MISPGETRMRGKQGWLVVALLLVLVLAGWRVTAARRAQQATVTVPATPTVVACARWAAPNASST